MTILQRLRDRDRVPHRAEAAVLETDVLDTKLASEVLFEQLRGSLIDGHLVVETDCVLLGTGLPRQRVVGPAHLDVARRGLRHLEDSHMAGIWVTEEAGEAVQERDLPVHGVSPLAPVHHNQGCVELVVEYPRHLNSTMY